MKAAMTKQAAACSQRPRQSRQQGGRHDRGTEDRVVSDPPAQKLRCDRVQHQAADHGPERIHRPRPNQQRAEAPQRGRVAQRLPESRHEQQGADRTQRKGANPPGIAFAPQQRQAGPENQSPDRPRQTHIPLHKHSGDDGQVEDERKCGFCGEGEAGDEEERKRFFFEKKKQKTFGTWRARQFGAAAPRCKSFLVLFFKKEHVYFTSVGHS
jgi:hypothetical protein